MPGGKETGEGPGVPTHRPTFAPPDPRGAQPSHHPADIPLDRHTTRLISRSTDASPGRQAARPDHHATQHPHHPTATPPSPHPLATPWTLTHAPAILGHGGWAGGGLDLSL